MYLQIFIFYGRKQAMTQYKLDFTIINPVPVLYYMSFENRHSLHQEQMWSYLF